MLKCVENCGPRHPPKRVPWARYRKVFKFILYVYIFLRHQIKNFTIEPNSYTAMLLYWFFDSLFSTCPKKMETEKWPKAADSPLPNFSKIDCSVQIFWDFEFFANFLSQCCKSSLFNYKNLLNLKLLVQYVSFY